MAAHTLVVDDDADVLSVIVDTLRISGFIVTAADTSTAMREILADKASLPIDAVVLDSSIPVSRALNLLCTPKACGFPSL